MNDLTSLPSSVRSYLAQVNQSSASPEAKLQEIVTVLARNNPEICMLVVSSMLGSPGYQTIETDESFETHRTKKSIMGFTYGEEVYTTRKFNRKTRQVRLLGNGRRRSFYPEEW